MFLPSFRVGMPTDNPLNDIEKGTGGLCLNCSRQGQILQYFSNRKKNMTDPDRSRVRDATPPPKYFADKKPFFFKKRSVL